MLADLHPVVGGGGDFLLRAGHSVRGGDAGVSGTGGGAARGAARGGEQTPVPGGTVQARLRLGRQRLEVGRASRRLSPRPQIQEDRWRFRQRFPSSRRVASVLESRGAGGGQARRVGGGTLRR